jgi:feruloyl esterase
VTTTKEFEVLRRRVVAPLVCAAICVTSSNAALAGAPSESCDTQTVQAMAAADTTVAFAAREAGGCRVSGYVTTRDPGPNQVLFTLGLPDRFNGRYLYLGVGGAAGQLPILQPQLLASGYALAGSDGGTGAKNGADFSFRKDPAKEADFLGRGVHVTAAATQHITRAYYAKTALHRYISGCSGGGSMGLTNGMHFGTQDFEGFIVGATPWGPGGPYMANVFHIAQYLQTHPEGWISPDQMARADKAILAAYDASDGAVDGIIADERNIKNFDVRVLQDAGFSPAQITTFNIIRNPQKYPAPLAGESPGYSITHVAAWSSFLLGTKPPPWPGTDTASASDLAASGAPFIHIMADTDTRAKEPSRNYVTAAYPVELTKLAAAAGNGAGDAAAADAGFAKLEQSGAKMLIYHGVDDQAMSYLETVKSYEALAAKDKRVAEWLRVFTVPGLMHCRGGAGPTDVEERAIEAVVNWVEHGQAPDAVVTNRVSATTGIERGFKLCAEPARATLKSSGLDYKQADNWECQVR